MDIICNRANELPGDLYKSMSAFRQKVFVERLGWNLRCDSGLEQDQFDGPDTVYVVAQSESGEVIGCGRLLPTTKPYLLDEVFPHLLNGVMPPRSRDIWELSRFAAIQPRRHAGDVVYNHLAERLLLHALLHCQRFGATGLLAVSTLPVERLMLRAGVDVQRLGPPSIIGGQPVLAFMVNVNKHSIASLLAFEGRSKDGGNSGLTVFGTQNNEKQHNIIYA